MNCAVTMSARALQRRFGADTTKSFPLIVGLIGGSAISLLEADAHAHVNSVLVSKLTSSTTEGHGPVRARHLLFSEMTDLTREFTGKRRNPLTVKDFASSN